MCDVCVCAQLPAAAAVLCATYLLLDVDHYTGICVITGTNVSRSKLCNEAEVDL